MAKVQLAKESVAHQKALATTMALEEKIEWLSQSITRDCPGTHAPSESWNQWKRRSRGWSRRHCKALLENSPAHSQAHSPPQWEGEEAEFDLGPPPELGPNVKRFFHVQWASAKKMQGTIFPQNPQQRSMRSG